MGKIKEEGQQYYPTYNLSPEAADVALKEYELAASTLAADEKVLSFSTSLLVGIIGIGAAFYKDNTKLVDEAFQNGISNLSGFTASAILFSLITLSAATYFADTRKTAVLASRKIVILRRMLGLSYGKIELVLPSRRIEGANEPYHLPMFHGWLSPKAVPIFCISIASGVFVWLFTPRNLLNDYGVNFEPTPLILALAWSAFVAFFYRLHLLDQYETVGRLFAGLVAKVLRQPLVKDIEYTIYRARLSVIEAKRLGTPLEKMRPVLIELEDRGFYQHSGVSLRAIIAAAYRYVSRRKRSGGSTITQQIARTLFIKRLHSALRRKLVEIFLALWFDKQFPKADIADIYICAVRYEHNVMGIAEALSHFFPGQKLNDISSAQTFFLIERVANVRSKLIVEKVSKNISHLRSKGLLSAGDVVSVMEIFREQVSAGRVIAPISDVTRLEDMCSK